MKRTVLLSVFMLQVLMLYAVDNIKGDGAAYQINLSQVPQGGSHIETGFVPADMPDVYYDSSEGTLTIIGYGEVAYYDVEIFDSSSTVVISDTVNGTYDTVDVSDLTGGTYIIECTTPIGHVFAGPFTVPSY